MLQNMLHIPSTANVCSIKKVSYFSRIMAPMAPGEFPLTAYEESFL